MVTFLVAFCSNLEAKAQGTAQIQQNELIQKMFEKTYILDNHKNSNEARNYYTIIGFNKVDAVKQNVFGVEMYNTRWVAQIAVNDDFVVKIFKNWGDDSQYLTFLHKGTKPDTYAFAMGGPGNLVTVKKGQPISINGTIKFEKHERGWVWVK